MDASSQLSTQEMPQILLVDDEPRILRSLKAALKHDYTISTAQNARQAKQIMQDNAAISVIVSDERMPGTLGHELLVWSKQTRPEVTRILMTGYSDLQAIQNSINEAEIFRYISKPWNLVEFKEVIKYGVIHERTARTHDETEAVISADCQLAFMTRQSNNDGLFKKVARMLSRKPLIAHDIGGVLSLLARQPEVGVLFIDDEHVNEDTISLVSMIHEKYPSVVIIVATTAADGHSAIKLLNNGQIFRYLVKPLTETRLKPMLNAAIVRFEQDAAKHQQIKQRYQDGHADSVLKTYWQKVISLWH
jgi:response regulator RpfG family c-di-GMP phosphodiesterase